MEKLKDKIVLLVGATGSIGHATARLLHQSGAIIYITGRNSEKLNSIVEELNIPTTQAIQVDVSNKQDFQRLADHLAALNVSPEILINASGIGIIKPFEQLTADDFMLSLNVNLMSTYYILHHFLPALREQKKGLIINIPGILGKTPMSGATAYAASKYALNGMMKSLREELKRTDIRITQLFLGGVDSAFWDNIDLRVQRDKMIMAEEAAKSIWFLCQQPTSGVVSEMVVQPFNHQVI
jgi:NADP-dependent 3-hydroxy acid dehydrogenase YdfG